MCDMCIVLLMNFPFGVAVVGCAVATLIYVNSFYAEGIAIFEPNTLELKTLLTLENRTWHMS